MNSNTEVELPAAITSITPQKKNKNRYSVFVDETFLIGISDSTLLKRELNKGFEITPAFFKRLQKDEGYNKCKNYILKLLGRREHARKELFRKALQKDYSAEIVETVLDELEEKDFIRDERFARKYAKDKSFLKKWGPAKISAHLRKKGVEKAVAQAAVDEAFEKIDIEECLRQLILKRKNRLLREKDELKRKQKAVNYLLQKGYRSENIFRYIDDLMKTLTNQNSD